MRAPGDDDAVGGSSHLTEGMTLGNVSISSRRGPRYGAARMLFVPYLPGLREKRLGALGSEGWATPARDRARRMKPFSSICTPPRQFFRCLGHGKALQQPLDRYLPNAVNCGG